MVPSLWFVPFLSFLRILMFFCNDSGLRCKRLWLWTKTKHALLVSWSGKHAFAGCLFLSCSSDFEELGAHLESWRLVILAMPLGLRWHPSVQTKVLLAGSIQGYVRGITFPSWAVNIEFSLGDLKWPSHPWTEIFLWEIGFHFQPPHFTAYHISHTSS